MNRREVKRAPVLRFKGFTNDWEQRKLKDCLEINSGRDYKHLHSGNIPVFGTGGYMLSVDEALSYKNAIGIGRKGTIDKPQLLIAPFWTVDTLFFLTPENDTDLYFLFSFFQKVNWKKYDESTGLPSLSKKTISTIKIKTPSKNEQIKIGTLIQKVNNLISLQQRKLELLKLFKIGMLQNILADTKAASKLKFKGSNQEWRPRRLNSITNIITKGTTPHFKQASNGVNFIKIEDISKDNGKIYPQSFITEKENNGYLKRSQLKADDLLFSIAGTLGRVGKVTDDILPANTNQALAIIRLKPSQNIDFCKIMLESDSVKRYIHANPTMGAQPNLSLKQISDLTLFFPDIKEQTLISQLIKKIDNLLALQYQNISKFKQLKQFLLQNIFI